MNRMPDGILSWAGAVHASPLLSGAAP